MENNTVKLKNRNGSWFGRMWSTSPIFSTLFALVVMILLQFVVMYFRADSFGNMFQKVGISWLNILRNNTYAGVIALGMCFIILSGGIDLSVGSMLCAIGAIVMFLLDEKTGPLAAMGITGPLAYAIVIIVAIAAGFVLGEMNGVLIAYGNIPAFIVTLGTMKIFRSVTQQLTQKFSPVVPSGFKQITSVKIGGEVIMPIIYWLVIVIIMHYLFKKTAFGRQTIAIGSNERAAKLSGINVAKVKRRIYALGGMMCGVAAVLYVARIGSMDFANAGSGYEMDAIAAVVVGGTSMAGGKGSLIGAFIGMLIIGVMSNILNMMDVPTFLSDAFKGLIIIFAVLLQKKEKI